MTEKKEAKGKYYSYAVQFNNEDDRDNFKNYLETRKLQGIPFYQTANEMLVLHKEKYKR